MSINKHFYIVLFLITIKDTQILNAGEGGVQPDKATAKKAIILASKKNPLHIGIIMDGNGRWAKQQGKARTFGHQSATEAVRNAIEGCAELGIRYLTLYAFSSENFGRPQEEVKCITDVMAKHLEGEDLETLIKNNIKITAIGDITKFPIHFQETIKKATNATKGSKQLHVMISVNYTGRAEIVDATKAIVADIQKGLIHPQEIDDTLFGNYLYTKGIPNPDLIIRTSGEMRLSGFLTWQSAYSEFYFPNVLWPDFRKDDLYDAIIAFQHRNRRFGKLNTIT